MRISDSVAKYILDLLNQENGTAEIQRNELANYLGCVPSQINYVLTSRFTRSRDILWRAGEEAEVISALPACAFPNPI